MKFLYKYPQCRYPYEELVIENAQRDRNATEYEVLDSGVFDDDRYWDIFIEVGMKSRGCVSLSTSNISMRKVTTQMTSMCASRHIIVVLNLRRFISYLTYGFAIHGLGLNQKHPSPRSVNL